MEEMKQYKHCGWLTIPAQRHKCDQALRLAVDTLKSTNVEFDTIAFCGMSGAMFAPILAYLMDKDVLCVRKDEKCNSFNVVEGHKSAERVLIVDDFRSTGRTIRRIMYRTRRLCGKSVVFVGALFYYSSFAGFFPLNPEPITNESSESGYLAYDLGKVIDCENRGSDPYALWET